MRNEASHHEDEIIWNTRPPRHVISAGEGHKEARKYDVSKAQHGVAAGVVVDAWEEEEHGKLCGLAVRVRRVLLAKVRVCRGLVTRRHLDAVRAKIDVSYDSIDSCAGWMR